ncbi:transporter substrate-binding domain-containing protein [Alteromonas lipolytica]|nr:transporter substrate-binding domain-containing protein [Alteromonas lipolytica]GGF79338.1 hypothetical protein GCM10011338_34630 [Alteromonas lipolytica]
MANPLPKESVEDVVIPTFQPGTGDFYFYIKTLLNLALTQSEQQFGPVVLKTNPQRTTQAEQFNNLKLGITDITWSVTTIKREQQFIPIRIPLTAGLFGYRVLVCREADPRFSSLQSPAQLKSLMAIQGADWPDTSIMEYNGYALTTANYEDTYSRLKQGSVDYFPRAAHEVFEELSIHADGQLIIKAHTALHYSNPMFFFVTKDKPELAERLLKGLAILAANGDLNRLLTSQFFYIRARNLLMGRTLYELENPLLSADTKAALAHYPSPLEHLFK